MYMNDMTYPTNWGLGRELFSKEFVVLLITYQERKINI